MSGGLFAVIPTGYFFNNYLSTKVRDRRMIIYLLISSLLFSILIINIFDHLALKFAIIFIFLIISCNLLEGLSTNMFSKIIPYDYELWTFNATFIIHISTTTGRIFGSLILFFAGFGDVYDLNRITYSVTAFLFVFCLIITLIYYKDLRIKAIARILRNRTIRKRKQAEL